MRLALGELEDVRALQGAVDGLAVVAGRAAERLDVGRAAELDRLADRHARGHRRALRDERAQSRDPAALELLERRAAPAHVTAFERLQPETARESVDLPAPLGPTTATSSPAWTVESAPWRIVDVADPDA